MSWASILPEEDRALYERAGFGRSAGLGDRPAVLIIDVQLRTVGDEPLPIAESVERYYKTSCGTFGWEAIPEIGKLVKVARKSQIPVIYPYVAPKLSIDAGRTGEKIPSLLTVAAHAYRFVEAVEPEPSDLLIPKRHPSAFFGTPLVSYLIDMGVDTLLLTGCTTSGCIRATATDAFAYNFHCAVIEECVYDRSEIIHKVNLFDINAKYADVIPLSTALRYCESLTLSKHRRARRSASGVQREEIHPCMWL